MITGEFYAQDLGPANLEMLSRFFEKYPSYAERTFLSVKGGTLEKQMAFSSSYVPSRPFVAEVQAHPA